MHTTSEETAKDSVLEIDLVRGFLQHTRRYVP